MVQRDPGDVKAEDALKTLEHLKIIRNDFEPMIDNLIQFVYPTRRFIGDKDGQKGQKTGMSVYDNTALFALNTLVDGMIGYLCSKNQKWFRFTVPGNFNYPRSSGMRGWTGRPIEHYPQVRQWLQDCAEVQYSALNRSNFYDQIPEFLRDGAGLGTAHLFAEEDLGSGRIMFVTPHFRECFIAEDQFGRVDTMYRVYKLTYRQMAQKWGVDRLKAIELKFAEDLADNPYQEVEVLHATFPRLDRDASKWDIGNAPIASLWIWIKKKKLIAESGYRWFPSISWRWRKNNDEIYGRGPGWDGFVDILLANEQGRTNLVGGHKMVEPPMSSGKDMRGLVNMGPKSFTYVENENQLKLITQLQTIANLPFAVEMQARTAQSIKDHFGEPFFNVLTQAAMQKVELTATQVVEITGERASILSTRVGRIESEGLSPIHERTFDIEARAGRMPVPPDILREQMGAQMMVEYLGVLSQVQKMLTEIKQIQTFFGLIGQVSELWPPAMDRIDGDKVVDRLADLCNFPEDCMSSAERTEGIRKSRAEAEAKQSQIEAMPAYAKLLRAAGPKPDQGSPAQQMLNPEENPQAGAQQ
jgi:hypothetical protein